MNNNRYSISIRHALMLLVLLLGFPSWGYARETFEQDGVKYSVVDYGSTRECVEVAGLSEASQVVVIPRSVGRYKVIAIGALAFRDCSGLTSVTIPESVTSIGADAFQDCSGLTSITIPESVTSIGEAAFSGCSSLTSVTIPEGVTSIGEHTFNGCRGLTSVTIPEGVTSIGGYAFYNCSGLTSITIPEGVTSIGYAAFAGCSNSLESLTIPNSVTSLRKWAFSFKCDSLVSLTIPDRFIDSSILECSNLQSLTVYGEDISSNCTKLIRNNSYLKSVTLKDVTRIIDPSVFTGCSGLTSFTVTIKKDVTSIGDEAFKNCSGLTSITIPESVTSIGRSAFDGCSGLTSITIPEGVTSIGDEAFKNCSGLTSVTIPESVTSIGGDAFYGCSGLTSVTIPESVTSIGWGAFRDCSGLTSVTIPEGVTSIGWSAFNGCSGLTSVTIPESVTSIGRSAFDGCRGLTSITIPEGVTSIGDEAFIYCTSLTSINIPNSVTTIGKCAFLNCSSLGEAMAIPSNVTEIADGTFMGCSNLPSVRLTSNVQSIGNHAFDGCKAFKSFVFTPNLTSVGISAFRNCSGLTAIKLPSKVAELGDYAFADCENLESAVFNSNVEINLTTFENDAKLKTLTSPANYFDGVALYNKEKTNLIKVFDPSISEYTGIPETVTAIGERAFKDCSNLSKVNLPSGLTSIGDDAFCNCEKLVLSAFPDNLKNVGARAFLNCGSITVNCSPSPLSFIGEQAFANCKSITGFTLSDNANLGEGVFKGCTALSTMNISMLKNIPNSLFENCTALSSVTTPADLASVGNRAFFNCSKLESIAMPDVASLGEEAFYGCSNLKEVNMPKVAYLPQNTFNGCSALNTANILSCSVIADSAFKDCAALQSIQIHPERIESIGNKAFWGCSSLTSPWEFLNSRMTIADSAFIGCTSLKRIRLRREVPSSEGQFAENMVVYVPMGSKEKYQNILPQCTIYGEYNKNDKEYQDILSMYGLYNQIDFKPLVDVESDAPWTENNVLTDASQLSANFADEYEGSLGALVDSSDESYFLSAWDADNPNEDYHYIQADLKKGCKAFNITFKRRSTNDNSAPTRVHVFVTNTLDDDNSWIDLGSDTLIYNDLTASINANYYAKVRYVRLQVEATAGNAKENGNLYFALNELDITPCRVNTPILKWDDGIYYAVKNNSFENAPSQVGNYETYLKGLTNGQFGDNSTPDKLFFKLQLTKPLKYVVVKYVKNNVDPTRTMLLNADDEKNSSFTFDADYRYYNNTTGIYCGQFQYPTDVISLWSNDEQSCYLRTAHIYTRPPKADLMSEDARTSIKDMLSQYDDKDFIGKDVFDALQSYCNEITRLAQTGRFVDFAKNEYSTFYADYPAVVPMLVKAGIVKEQNGELVVDYIYNEGDVIPANTGVILKGNCMGNAYVMEKATTDATSATSPEGNLLHGTIDDEETSVDGCSRYYMLLYDKATDCRLGFYWKGENGPQPFINKAYKAYLAIPDTYSAMGKESFSLADMEKFRGDITPISSLSDDKGHVQGNIYGIDGRKVINKDLKKLPSGLYIVNGKKVVVK